MTTEAKWSDFASLDRAKTLAAANRLLPGWVSVLLAVLIAWQLARIIWMLIPGPAAGDAVSAPAAQQRAAGTPAVAADVRSIADAHIFGVAAADVTEAPRPVIVETENLADTRLTNLSLKGTMASEMREMSIAIIADSGKDEKIYVVGDRIGSGATLHAVYRDRVVLDENGVLTNLKLPKDFPAANTAIARRSTSVTRSTATVDDSIQAVVAQNVTRLADVIRPTPYFVNGEQQGYRVYPGRDRAQFAALGLRPGDLIKDIDGQALTDPSQAMQIFQSLGDADQVSVTVERNGQQEVITLNTNQLDLGDDENTE